MAEGYKTILRTTQTKMVNGRPKIVVKEMVVPSTINRTKDKKGKGHREYIDVAGPAEIVIGKSKKK